MFFFQKDFWFKIFFAENIWVQIWLIVAHMDLQPDNTYLNNQRLAFERTQIDHHEDLTERGRETKYFGAWCIHISPSLSKIHIMGHPKRSKKFRLRSKIQLMGYSQNFYQYSL